MATQDATEVQLGVLNRAEGSCRYTRGKTMVVAAVFGPVEALIKNEQTDRATLVVQVRPAQGQSLVNDRDTELFIQATFESAVVLSMHPRTQINIIVQVVNDDGGLLAAMINATSCALVDAGIPMHFVPAASSSLVSDGSPAVLEPTAAQETKKDDQNAVLTFVFGSDAPSASSSSASSSAASLSLLSSFTRGNSSFLEEGLFSALSACRSHAQLSVLPSFRSSFESRAAFYQRS